MKSHSTEETGKTGVVKHQWTQEQEAIIESAENISINAVAGSGKTTTVIQYAATRPKGKRILYLAFNKSVKLEAVRKFSAAGMYDVKVETAHSLAYKHIVPQFNYRVKSQGYKTSEIADMLGLQGTGEKHAEHIIANHINKFITYFCNSDKMKVQDLDYISIIQDEKARSFARTFHKYIVDGTRVLLAKMDKGEIEITHDFYLKKFQLSKPKLSFDYILFDEGQDASAAMLDVFLSQASTKVIVGDMHQQIYGWRYAVNALTKTNFNILQLSTSFRFPTDIAKLAMNILDWKNHLEETKIADITGKGSCKDELSKATIARTNLGLLLKAIEFTTDNPSIKHIYFEGNINSYTYADDGASLYDVLNLYNKKKHMVRDPLIKSMNNMDELEDYIEKTEDVQLGMMVKIVKEYENEIPGIIKSLKNLHTGDEDRGKAEMIFSTVHRAKGMEYDVVHLVDDFVTEAKLEKLKTQPKEGKEPLSISKWNEEINLLYVAVTRAKKTLHIPESLLPKAFPGSEHIVVVKNKKETETLDYRYDPYYEPFYPPPTKSTSGWKSRVAKEPKPKAYSVLEKRSSYRDAYQPWTDELDEDLKQMVDRGNAVTELALHFGRTKGAILARMKKLGYYPE